MRSDTESTGNDRDGLLAQFVSAVSCLAEGELTFRAPFDLATSAALASNDDTGALAEEVFKLAASRDCGYRVTIHAVAPGGCGIEREVINTTTPSTAVLMALLEGFLEELYDRHGID